MAKVDLETAELTPSFLEDDSLVLDHPLNSTSIINDSTAYNASTEANEEATLYEAADVLYPLPVGWPKIPEIFVRRSWNFSTATCPSINKAIAHLELLQTVIEDWALHAKNDIISRASSASLEIERSKMTTACSDVGSGKVGRKQIRFTPSVVRSLETPGKQLSVQGIGAILEKDDPNKKPNAPQVEFEIPYLGAEDVIDEVITLLAKLENDRGETKKMLQQERERMEMLSKKIDHLLLQRLQALPDAVQIEHEACAMDINELTWHVSYRGRVEARIQNKANVAETLNSRLKEDIAYVKKHCPLVEEKLDLESEAMERIKQAQSETNDELDQTTERYNKVSAKSNDVHSKANEERKIVRADLDSVRKDLNSISGELSEAKSKYNGYIQTCYEHQNQLVENDRELTILQLKNDNAKTAEAMQAAKVRDLKGKIIEEEFENKKLEDEKYSLKSQLENQKKDNETIEKDLEMGITKSEENLRQLTRLNKECEMDIEDNISKIQECDKQRIADEKNLVRMAKELERTNESMKVTDEDLAKVKLINKAVKEKLHAMEDHAMMEEEGLKARAEALRKQIKEEIHSKTVIQARIKADSTELSKDEVETKAKKDKVSKKVEEVDLVVKSVLEKVVKLRSAHDEKIKTIADLTEEINTLERKKTTLLESSMKEVDSLEPKHRDKKAELTALEKRIDHMEWKTEIMNKNIDDMDSSSKMMTKMMEKAQVAIDKLQNELDALTVKLKAGQHMQDKLQFQLNQVIGRIQESKKAHAELMDERTKIESQHTNDLTTNLKLNKEIAAKYRRLQNEYITLKNDMLNHLDGRVQAETSVKDLKKVQGLQKKMHTALSIYYKLRGLYNRAELARMEIESAQNNRRVGELREDIDLAVNGMSKFITAQMTETRAKQTEYKKLQFASQNQTNKDTDHLDANVRMPRQLTQSTIQAVR